MVYRSKTYPTASGWAEVAADDLVADDQPPDASGVPFAQALPHLEEQHALGTAEFHAACEANLGE